MPFRSPAVGGLATFSPFERPLQPTGFEDPQQFNLENDFTGGRGGSILDNLESLPTVPEDQAMPLGLEPYVAPKTKRNVGEGLMSDDEFEALLQRSLAKQYSYLKPEQIAGGDGATLGMQNVWAEQKAGLPFLSQPVTTPPVTGGLAFSLPGAMSQGTRLATAQSSESPVAAEIEALREEIKGRVERNGTLLDPAMVPKFARLEYLKQQFKGQKPQAAQTPEFRAFDKETRKWYEKLQGRAATAQRNDLTAIREQNPFATQGNEMGGTASGLLQGAAGLARPLLQGAEMGLNAVGATGLAEGVNRFRDFEAGRVEDIAAGQQQAVAEQKYGWARRNLNEAIPDIAASLSQAVAVAPSGLAGMAGAFGVIQGSQAYDDARKSGLSNREALKHSVVQGSIEAGVMLAFNKLGKLIPGFAGLEGKLQQALAGKVSRESLKAGSKRIAIEVGAETLEELITAAAEQTHRAMTIPGAEDEGSWRDKNGNVSLDSPMAKTLVRVLRSTWMMMGLTEGTQQAQKALQRFTAEPSEANYRKAVGSGAVDPLLNPNRAGRATAAEDLANEAVETAAVIDASKPQDTGKGVISNGEEGNQEGSHEGRDEGGLPQVASPVPSQSAAGAGVGSAPALDPELRSLADEIAAGYQPDANEGMTPPDVAGVQDAPVSATASPTLLQMDPIERPTATDSLSDKLSDSQTVANSSDTTSEPTVFRQPGEVSLPPPGPSPSSQQPEQAAGPTAPESGSAAGTASDASGARPGAPTVTVENSENRRVEPRNRARARSNAVDAPVTAPSPSLTPDLVSSPELVSPTVEATVSDQPIRYQPLLDDGTRGKPVPASKVVLPALPDANLVVALGNNGRFDVSDADTGVAIVKGVPGQGMEAAVENLNQIIASQGVEAVGSLIENAKTLHQQRAVAEPPKKSRKKSAEPRSTAKEPSNAVPAQSTETEQTPGLSTPSGVSGGAQVTSSTEDAGRRESDEDRIGRLPAEEREHARKQVQRLDELIAAGQERLGSGKSMPAKKREAITQAIQEALAGREAILAPEGEIAPPEPSAAATEAPATSGSTISDLPSDKMQKMFNRANGQLQKWIEAKEDAGDYREAFSDWSDYFHGIGREKGGWRTFDPAKTSGGFLRWAKGGIEQRLTSVKRASTTQKKNLAQRAAEARGEVSDAAKDFLDSFGDATLPSGGFSGESLKKFAVLTAKLVKAGALTFADYTAELAKMFDAKIVEALRPHMQSAFDTALAEYQAEQDKDSGFGEAPVAIEEPPVEPPTKERWEKLPAPKGTTSIKNRKMDEFQEERGEEPYARFRPGEKVEDWAAEARRRVKENPNLPQQLVQSLIDSPRPLDHVEFAMLQDHHRQNANDFDQQIRLRNEAHAAGDAAAEVDAQQEIQNIRNRMDNLGIAAAIGKSFWGKAGNALQIELKKDFSIEALSRRMKAAKVDGKLSEADETLIEELHKKIADAVAGREEADARAKAAETREALEREHRQRLQELLNERKQHPVGTAKPTRPARSAKAKQNTMDAIEKYRAKKKDIGSRNYSVFLPGIQYVELVPEAALVIRAYVSEKVANFADFMDRLKADAPDLADEGEKHWKGQWNATHVADITDKLIPETEDAELGPNAIRDVARELHKFVIERDGLGMKPEDREKAVDGVHEILANVKDEDGNKVLEDWSREDTAEAMSGLGRFSPLSEDEIDKVQREHKGQLLPIIQRTRYWEKGKHPPVTGQEKTPDSEYQREERRKTREAKKNANIPEVIDPDRQLKSVLDGMIRAVRNRIADLTNSLYVTGQRITTSEKANATSDTLEDLRAWRDMFQAVYDAIHGKKQLSDEQKLAMLDKLWTKQIDQLEKEIPKGILYPDPKVTKRPPLTPAMEAKKARLDTLLAQRAEARLVSPQTVERSLTAKEKSLLKQIENVSSELTKMVDTDREGGTAPTAPLTKPTNANIAMLEDQLAKLRSDLDYERKNSPEWQARSDAAYDRRVTQRYEYWTNKRLNREFGPKVKPAPRKLTDAQMEAEFKVENAKAEFAAAEEQARIEGRTPTEKLIDVLGHAYDFRRDILSTGELSPVGRQGLLFVSGHWIRGAVDTAKALQVLFSRDADKALSFVNQSIKDRPNYKAGLHAGVPYADKLSRITPQQEVMIGEWVKRLPLLESLVKRFESASKAFLNLIRADMTDSMLATRAWMGGAVSAAEAKVIANAAGVLTGHGNVDPGVAKYLNKVFYSSVFTMSKIENAILAPLWMPQWTGHGLKKRPTWKGSGKARAAIAKEYVQSAVGLFILQEALRFALSLIPAAGGDDDEVTIENDPRSSEFRKLRMGRTRLDVSGGYMVTPTLIARIATGEKAREGIVTPLGSRFGDSDQWDLALNWFRSRLHPTVGPVVDRLMGGKTVVGERVRPLAEYNPLTAKGLKNLASENVPMAYPDVLKAEQELGLPRGTAAAAAAFFGGGLQTYGETKPETNQRIAKIAATGLISEDTTKAKDGLMKGYTTSQFIEQVLPKARMAVEQAKAPLEQDRAQREYDKMLNAVESARANDVMALSARAELNRRVPLLDDQLNLLKHAWIAEHGSIREKDTANLKKSYLAALSRLRQAHEEFRRK